MKIVLLLLLFLVTGLPRHRFGLRYRTIISCGNEISHAKDSRGNGGKNYDTEIH